MSSAARQEKHKIGVLLMSQGKHLKALEVLTNAYNDHGSYILLLGDLIACHYVLGQNLESSYYLNKYENELQTIEGLLSSQVLAKALVFLGKMQEEHALLDQAFKSYSKAVDSQSNLWTNSQLLRFQAVYGIHKNLEKLYTFCTEVYPLNDNEYFEAEHARLLAELHLFGIEKAFVHLKNLLSNAKIQPADQRLLYFDFLEFVLQKKDSNLSDLKDLLIKLNLTELDPYEACLEKILMDSEYKLNPVELNRLSQTVSLLSTFRLSRLANYQNTNPTTDISVKNKKLLLMQWRSPVAKNPLSIQLCLSTGRFSFGEKVHFVKPFSLNMIILKTFTEIKSIDTEEFIKNVIEKHELNEYTYDTVKKAVSRVNLLIFELVGKEKAFKLNQHNLTLNHQIQISVKTGHG